LPDKNIEIEEKKSRDVASIAVGCPTTKSYLKFKIDLL
jgi:hypothetical protein